MMGSTHSRFIAFMGTLLALVCILLPYFLDLGAHGIIAWLAALILLVYTLPIISPRHA